MADAAFDMMGGKPTFAVDAQLFLLTEGSCRSVWAVLRAILSIALFQPGFVTIKRI